MHVRLDRRLAPALVSCLTALGCAAPPPGAPPLPASGRHRLQASGAAADALVAAGATLVADHGTFRVLDASPSALAAVPRDAVVEYRDEYLRVALNSGELDTSIPERLGVPRAPVLGAAGKALHLVQLAGPVPPGWIARLEATGARVVSYVPWNAFLLYGDAAALGRVHDLARSREVQAELAYLPAHKIDRDLATRDTGSYAVQLVEDPAVNEETLALAARLSRLPGTASAALGYVNLVVHADRAAAEALAARPDVVSVQPWSEPRLLDERQDVIVAGQLSSGLPAGPGYLSWLASKGFTQAQFDASGFGVDVSDSGVDNGTTAPNHFGLYRQGAIADASRVAYARLEGTPHVGSSLEGCDGHGTLNAHVIAGFSDRDGFPFSDAEGYRYGLGIAPFVRIGSSVVFDDAGRFTYPDAEDLVSRAYADGMRISSNSWGSSTSAYTFECQRYDALVRDAAPDGSAAPLAGNQPMVIVFAAGNDGPVAASVHAPGSAKNVLSVGASENVRAFGGADRCQTPDAEADAALDVASFSSRGPTADGRIRPDLLAPGTHVTGGVAQAPGQRAEPPAVPTGDENACFDASAVCGGVASGFFPADQRWYTASTGTSHSTPAVAGAAALVRQWFVNEGLAPPSPAMTKAFVMNSARYMTGAGGADALYSSAQGMGLLDLGAAFDGTARLLRDQEPADLFTATGQARTFADTVGDPSRPFRVTLAWTDAPGSTVGSAWMNDLDLTVSVAGATYKGNVFAGPASVTGGAADPRNNVESVFLPAGTTGPFTVTVTAANLNSDGVPGNGSAPDQDFALVVSNGCADPRPPPPTGLAARATADNEITVTWTPDGADAYAVYRAGLAGGPYARIATVAGPPLVDGGRSGGSTFHYVVRAQRGCAESPLSAEASATATGPCTLAPSFAGLRSASTTGAVTCGNTLAWQPATPSCGGTVRYDVFRSTTASFAPDASTRIAAGIGGTDFVDTGSLVGGTTYHYVVRALETTAVGTLSDGNTVQRSTAPFVATVLLRDDFDGNRPANAAAWWTELADLGRDDLSLVPACRWHSASNAYRFGAPLAACGGAYDDGTDNTLVLGGDGTVSPQANGILLPPGADVRLTFRAWYDLEPARDASSAAPDGATLTWSTSSAQGWWQTIPDQPMDGWPYIVAGPYDGIFSTGRGQPERGWTGTAATSNGAFGEVVVDLSALAGLRVWLGWHFASDPSSDPSNPAEGFYLDDVRIDVRDPACTTCATPAPAPPADVAAAASGDNEVTVSWTASAADGYEVHRALVAGGPYALVATIAAPPFVDRDVSQGLTYRYVVRALSGCARSAESSEASATATGLCRLPPAFAGLASADTTGGLTCGNALAWTSATASCGGAVAYDVYRSLESGFTPGPATRVATGVTATAYVDSGSLMSDRIYHYVVRAVETGPAGSISDGNVIERDAAPNHVPLDFHDDFDARRPPSAAAWWTEQALLGPEQLELVTGCHWQTDGVSYRFGQAGAACGGVYPLSTENLLVLGGDGSSGPTGFPIPVAGTSTLRFRVWYDLERAYDGAYLAWSTSGPLGPFTPVPDAVTPGAPYIVQGGYDATLPSGARAWSGQAGGANGALKLVVVNLDALAGQTVWFGWRFSSDAQFAREGLYLDDVAVETRAVCSTIPVTPGAPVEYRLSGLPAKVRADDPVFVTITALDVNGQVASDYAGQATFTSDDPAAVLPGPATFTSGVATASLRLRTAGAQTVTVVDLANVALVASGTVTVTPGPPGQLAFAEEPRDAVAGVPMSPPVRVVVQDAFGNQVTAPARVSIALAAAPPGATLGGTTAVDTVNGAAVFDGLRLTLAGAGYALVARLEEASATSRVFAVLGGPPAALAFSRQPSGGVAGEPLAPAPAVEARDVFGNLCTGGATVTIALVDGPPGATLSGETSVVAPDGLAEFRGLVADRAGAGYQLLASSGSAPAVLGDPFAVVAGPPRRALLLVQPGTVVAGAPFDPPIRAGLVDAFGNPSLQATTTLSLTLASNPSLGTLLGATSVPAVDGIATFPGAAIDRAGVAYALYVGAAGLLGDVSVGFDVLAGAATRYALLGPAIASVGTEVEYEAVARDALSNDVAGYAGTATVTSSDPAATLPAAPVAFAGGRAGPVRVTLRTPGPHTLTLTDTAGGPTGTTAVTVSASGAPHLAVSGLPAALAADAPATITITALDASGQVSAEYAGAATLSSSDGAAVLPAAPVPFTRGVATATIRFRTAGAQSLRAFDAAGGAVEAWASASVLAGPPAVLRFAAQPSGGVAGRPLLPAPTVELLDAFGNRAPSAASVSLSLAAGPAGATLSGTTLVPAADGIATFPGLALDEAGAGYALLASSGALTAATTAPFEVVAGPAARYVVWGPSAATAGVPVTYALQALDAFSNPATAYHGRADVTSTDAAATFPSPVAFAGGEATATVTFQTAGPQSLTFADGAAAAGGTISVAVSPAPAARFVVSGLPVTRTADALTTVTLTAVDASGRVAAGYEGEAVLASSDPAAVLPDAPIAFAGGVGAATVRLRTAGVQSLLVSAYPDLAGSASTIVVAGAPAALRFVVHPSGGVAGQPLSPPPTVDVLDAFGNRAASTAAVTLAVASGPAGATLSGTLALATGDGVATFADLALDRAGPGYALRASSGALPPATSAEFAVVAGRAERYALSGPSAAASGVQVTYALQALDVFANAAAGHAARATVSSTDPAATFPATVELVGGQATAPVTFRTAGPQTLTFTDPAGGATGAILVAVEEGTPGGGGGGGGGCGAGGAGGASSLLLALAALLRRRASLAYASRRSRAPRGRRRPRAPRPSSASRSCRP